MGNQYVTDLRIKCYLCGEDTKFTITWKGDHVLCDKCYFNIEPKKSPIWDDRVYIEDLKEQELKDLSKINRLDHYEYLLNHESDYVKTN